MNWIKRLFFPNKTEPKLTIRGYGRDEYIYQEGDYKMVIHTELLAGGEGVIIYFSSIWQWLPPHNQNGFGLPFEEREKILKRFCRYLESRRTKYTVE